VVLFPFAPEVCIPTLKNMYDKYGDKGLWDKYGFKDAFNPTVDWFDSDYLGLDVGPIVIMIENYKTGLSLGVFNERSGYTKRSQRD
jgi:hypothetical protein